LVSRSLSASRQVFTKPTASRGCPPIGPKKALKTHCGLADLSLPNLDRDMEFVWTLKHSDKTNWQRSSSVQIKPPRFTTRPLLGLGPRACGLVRQRCTKHVRQHLPRKRCGDEGVQYSAIFDKAPTSTNLSMWCRTVLRRKPASIIAGTTCNSQPRIRECSMVSNTEAELNAISDSLILS